MTICKDLDESMQTAEINGTVGSILETFNHILQAEAGFLRRIYGTSPQPAFEWEDGPSLDQMAAFAFQLGEAFLDTLQNVSPTANVHEENSVWSFDYQARLIFMSLVYHGVSHRTDITSYLASRGVELPELDIWGYQSANPERFEAILKRVRDK